MKHLSVFVSCLFYMRDCVWFQCRGLVQTIHEPFKQVLDQDIGQDKRLGIAKLPLIELEAEVPKEFELRLLPSLDMLKIKDKKDRGTVTIKVVFTLYCLPNPISVPYNTFDLIMCEGKQVVSF